MAKKILLFSVIFLLSLQVISDTDFGWHLRVGEYIASTKSIPFHDLFSFSLPDYQYVYHSWAGELLIFTGYKAAGLWGVSVIHSLVLTLSMFLIYQILKLQSGGRVNSLLMLLSTILFISLVGGRMRVFGLLFTALLYFLFLKYQNQNSKLLWATPLVTLVWASFHGSFVVGLGILYLLTAIQRSKILALVSIVSTLSTIINPYGPAALRQALIMPKNAFTNLYGVNSDWQPLLKDGTPAAIIILAPAILLLILKIAKLKIEKLQWIFIALFLLATLVLSRFAFALAIFFLPQANNTIYLLKTKLSKSILSSKIITFSRLCVLLIFPLTIIVNLLQLNFSYKSTRNYNLFLAQKLERLTPYPLWPYEASQFYLEKYGSSKRPFVEASLANFLIFQNPKIKVFYYGPMDNFFANGQPFAIPYLNILFAKNDWQNPIDAYQIDTVFVPNQSPLITKLKSEKSWQEIYQDKDYTILAKD